MNGTSRLHSKGPLEGQCGQTLQSVAAQGDLIKKECDPDLDEHACCVRCFEQTIEKGCIATVLSKSKDGSGKPQHCCSYYKAVTSLHPSENDVALGFSCNALRCCSSRNANSATSHCFLNSMTLQHPLILAAIGVACICLFAFCFTFARRRRRRARGRTTSSRLWSDDTESRLEVRSLDTSGHRLISYATDVLPGTCSSLERLMADAAQRRVAADNVKRELGAQSVEYKAAYNHTKAKEFEITDWVKTRVPNMHRSSKLEDDKHYVLASCPEYAERGAPALALANHIITILGFANIAGDAKDPFHTEVLPEAAKADAIRGWRLAWYGKVEASTDIISKTYPGKTVVLVIIAGGEECIWERHELEQTIIPHWKSKGVQIELLPFANWRDFVRFFLGVSA